jgi:hypothetical protein
MSTAALASARRRRTTNEQPSSSQNVSNKPQQQESPNSVKQVLPSAQTLTPLQILQLHDNKLKDLEALLIELNSEEYITNVVEEKIDNLIRSKLMSFSNDLDTVKVSDKNSNSFETKLQMLETSIQTNLTIQNVKFDEFKNKIQENFNIFKDNTTKMMELLNVRAAHVANISEPTTNVEKLELLTKEVNELKLLVIKNQTLALETCTSLINMKDDIKLSNEKIAQTIDKVGSMNMCCNESQCDPAQMFLQSFMKTKLFGGANKINIDSNYDNADGEDDDNDDNDDNDENCNQEITNKKLHIDLTNEELVLDDDEIILDDDKIINDTNELIIDENQLQEILQVSAMEEINLNSTSLKQDVFDEIKNISLDNNETNLETQGEIQLSIN